MEVEDITGQITGVFETYAGPEYGLTGTTIGTVAGIAVGLVGSDWVFEQAKKYIEWFGTAEEITAKIVLGAGLLLAKGWLKLEGFSAGLVTLISIGTFVSVAIDYVKAKGWISSPSVHAGGETKIDKLLL